MSDPTALPRFGAPAPPQLPQLRERVLATLGGLGLPGPGPQGEVVLDEDGDVALLVDEQLLFVRCVESRPPLLRVFGQWRLDDRVGTELQWLRAANAVTGALNLIKASVFADRLTVAVDVITVDGLDLASLLPATFDAVLGSVRTWHETVAELASGTPPFPPGPADQG